MARNPQDVEYGGLVRGAMWAVFLLVLGWIAVRGWMSDDAAITARTIDNLLNGYGLRWNVDERVQSYTHPLWALLSAAPTWLFGNWYWGLMFQSIVCSGLYLWMTIGRSEARASERVAMAMILVSSFAFIDYSTSGLENPLTNLLVAVFAVLSGRATWSAGRVATLTLVVAALALNRLDAILMLAPGWLVAVVSAHRHGIPARKLAMAIAAGTIPLALWEVFSVIYYGFPFPNTAYAKIAAGVPLSDRIPMGIDYFFFTATRDPATMIGSIGIAVGLWRRRAQFDRPSVVGAGLYWLYIIWIGGGFMMGRFFASPLALLVAAWLVQGTAPGTRRRLVVGAVCVAAAVAGWYGHRNDKPNYAGAVDERRAYAENMALVNVGSEKFLNHAWSRKGARWRARAEASGQRLVKGSFVVGMIGLAAGPNVYIFDHLALTDPLIARLPAAWDIEYRAGHLERMGQWNALKSVQKNCPVEFEVCRFWRDYHRSLVEKKCRLDDPGLCQYWDELRLVTEGPLFSRARWRAIWRFNTGANRGLIDVERYRMAAEAYQGPMAGRRPPTN